MNREKHWSRTNESTTVLGIRILLAVFRLGGRVVFHATLWPVVLFYWLFSSNARKASNSYLRHVEKFSGRKPGSLSSLMHIARFADTILDKFLAISNHFTIADLEISGRDELLSDQRGAVLVTSHSGCLELCQVLSENPQARQVHVLVHTKHAVKFNEALARINPKFQTSHIEVTSITPQTAITLSEYIQKGEYVVIVGDRTPIGSEAVTTAEFLGETAPFPTGPFLLATILKCPAWSMICTRGTSSRYRLTFEHIADFDSVPRKQRDAFLKSSVQKYADLLAARMCESPYDWFNFFNFWHPGSK